VNGEEVVIVALSLLLVEDDPADAMLVDELIAEAVGDIRMVWVRSVADAQRELANHRPDCVLLDLHLPDASGIDALARIAEHDATIPVVVLTGLSDEHFAVSAVASGAQDYLIKGRVEADGLHRSLLYAIERKRNELTVMDLHTSQLRAQENARLERGLLPTPLLLNDPGVDIVASYRPSRPDALLGGDFYDVVQTQDGTVHVLIGDVAGHGPDEAALGAALRIAWRALTLAGVQGVDRVRQLEQLLHAERADTRTFATVLDLAIAPGSSRSSGSSRVTAIRAGHPPMLLHSGDRTRWVEPPGGPPLGVHYSDWPPYELELRDGEALLLVTDGLFEGHSGRGNERLGEDGLLELARGLAGLPGAAFVDALIDATEEAAAAHGGLADDVAVVWVERTRR
jgi:serine phosphatase RsbU (regulator of sigma subunit)